MKDQFNRTINYMRISLIDQCNYHCSYCKDDSICLKHDYLSYDEILIIVKEAIKLGITKFKITGGEPFIRKGAVSFIKELKHTEGVEEVTITTNGSLLSFEDLKELKDVDCINFSLDTLDNEHYYKITKNQSLQKVIDNIIYASSLHMNIKINCVLSEYINNQEILDLLMFANQHQFILRFIELMPMKTGSKVGLFNKQYVLNLARDHHIDLIETKIKLGNGPAHYYQMNETYIGFIEPIHGKFCHECNRIRLTSSGYLKACLFHETGCDLKKVLQDQGNIKQIMKEVIYDKPASHQFEERAAGVAMNKIGG